MNAENKIAIGAAPIQAREYETKEELAERLGVSLRTIDNLVARGMPHIKITRKLVRFPRRAVDQWLCSYEIRRA